jgi:hypothetical protein
MAIDISDVTPEALMARWTADDGIERAGADLFLRAALKTLDRPEEQKVVERRLSEKPSLLEYLDDTDIDGQLDSLREPVEFAR